MPGGFGRARETSLRGVYKVIVSAWHENIARSALFAARELVLGGDGYLEQPANAYDVTDAIERSARHGGFALAGPIDRLYRRGRRQPQYSRHPPSCQGQPRATRLWRCSQRIWTAETDLTPAIAESISRDKDLTKDVAQSCGVPVPEGRIVNSAKTPGKPRRTLVCRSSSNPATATMDVVFLLS